MPLLALGLASCAGRDADRPAAIRLIAEEGVDSATGVLGATEVFRWRFETPEDLAEWSFNPPNAQPRVGPGGLSYLSFDRPTAISRRLGIEASALDIIELETEGTRIGAWTLHWLVEGDGRRWGMMTVTAAQRQPGREAPNLYRFMVGRHPDWRDRVLRVAFRRRHGRPSRPAGRRVAPSDARGGQVRSLRGLSLVPDAEALARAASVPVKADLDSDVRNARLGLPGLPIDWEVAPPPGSRLRFSYAVPDTVPFPVEFVVSDASAGSESRELFRTKVGAGASASGEWHESGIDLPGRIDRLRLEVHAEHRPDPLEGFPLWGNPEIVPADRRERPPNVVLVSLDTVRADHLSLYGYDRPTSPRLEAWARRNAVTFEDAVAQAPWTLPSHVSMLTGLDAFRHGINYNGAAGPELVMLQELLRQQGYATLAVTGGAYVHPSHGFAQGFDRYRYEPRRLPEDELERSLEVALDWLREVGPRPFFLFFHTYEAHVPYRPREGYFEPVTDGLPLPAGTVRTSASGPPLAENGFVPDDQTFVFEPHASPNDRKPLTAADRELVRGAYDSGVAYADAQLGRLLDELERLGLDEQTLVIVTSDHGESLYDDQSAGHGNLREDNLLVPLVIRFPQRRWAGRSIGRQVRSIDLVPTVLEALRLEPSPGIDGVSLLPLLENDAAVHPPAAFSYASNTNLGVALRLDGRFKYTYNNTAWMPPHGAEALQRLAPGVADPSEDERVKARMREELLRALARDGRSLRVRFANGERVPLTGRLLGPAVQASSVKALRLPGRRIRWREEGAADFEVLPGETFDLHLERGAPRLSFIASLGGGGPVSDLEVELDASEGAQAVAWDGGEWRVTDGDALPVTGFRVWWSGMPKGEEASPQEVDPELARRLEALGYLQ